MLWFAVSLWLVIALAGVRQSGGDAIVPLLGAVGTALVLFWLHTRRRRAERLRVSTLRGLLALSPPAFEQAVATMLSDRGYRRVERLGGAGDLMADIRALDPSGRAVVVQCKRYAPQKKVTSPELQAFIGMAQVHHRAQVGIYVTTSDFTGPARALAREHGVRLVDGATLTEWIGGSRRPSRINGSTVVADDRSSGSRTPRPRAPWPVGEDAGDVPAPPAVMASGYRDGDQPRD